MVIYAPYNPSVQSLVRHKLRGLITPLFTTVRNFDYFLSCHVNSFELFLLLLITHHDVNDVLGKLTSLHMFISIDVDFLKELAESEHKFILFLFGERHCALHKSDEVGEFDACGVFIELFL